MKFTFTPDNVIERGTSFPRLKITSEEKYGRVVLMGDLEMAFAHTLRHPEIGPDGKPIMTKAERKINGQTEWVDVNQMKFIGRWRCFGDPDVIQGKPNPDTGKLEGGRGVDPDNCIMCKAAVENSAYIPAPERRFAMHVAKYNTKPGSADIKKPFHVEIVVWPFTDGVYNKLTEFQKELDKKGESLSQRDLKLQLTSSEMYQKYDIDLAGDAEWMATEKTRETLMEAWQEPDNRCDDLESMAARKKDSAWIEADLKTVYENWAIAKGEATKPAAANSTSDLNNFILGNGKNRKVEDSSDDDDAESDSPPVDEKPKRTRAPKVTTDVNLDDNDEGSGDDPEPKLSSSPNKSDFDKLMSGINVNL